MEHFWHPCIVNPIQYKNNVQWMRVVGCVHCLSTRGKLQIWSIVWRHCDKRNFQSILPLDLAVAMHHCIWLGSTTIHTTAAMDSYLVLHSPLKYHSWHGVLLWCLQVATRSRNIPSVKQFFLITASNPTRVFPIGGLEDHQPKAHFFPGNIEQLKDLVSTAKCN